MNAKMKNISRSEVLNAEGTDLLSGWTGCQQDSGAKLGGEHHPVLLCKGEEISSHKSDGDASSPVWTALEKSPLTERNICFTRGNPSSCRPGTSCGVWTRGLQDAFGRCILSNRGFVSCHPKPIHRPYQCGF